MSCGKVVTDLPSDGGHPDAAIVDAGSAVDAPPPAPTVRALRVNPPASGTPLMLKNVVVVAHSTRTNGVVYVQDQGISGPNNGILLFCQLGAASPCKTTRAQIDGLAIGEVVDVSGVYEVYTPPGTGGLPAPRIVRPNITKKGSVVAPAFTTIMPSQAAFDANPAQVASLLEVYVRVMGTDAKIADLMPAELATTCPNSLPDGGTVAATRGVRATLGGAQLDLVISPPELSYCVTQCGVPPCATEMMVGDNLTLVQGVLEISYQDDGQGHLTPTLVIGPAQDADLGH